MKKDITAIATGLFAVLYLINPGAGFFEFIPDNLPIIGNLDEAMAVLIIISVLQHFGIKVPDFFKDRFKDKKPSGDKPVITIMPKE
jgi:uncharacterized membrane protein YkvA (DUF1232 family)